MAYNLAMTLKAAEPGMPVALVHDSEAVKYLTDRQMAMFDVLVPTRQAGLHLKLDLPNLSPF